MGAYSNEPLLPYLSAARTASPDTAAQICLQATADPSLHHFAELLALPSLAALRDSPHHTHHALLLLFAHGTVADYRRAPASFPPLSPPHWRKLRTLTLVSLAAGRPVLAYPTLQRELGVQSVRDVEDVVRDAVYAGLLRARMDQREGRVEVGSAVGRDVVAPAGVVQMADTLREWVARSARLVAEIDGKVEFIAAHAAAAAEQKAEASEAMAAAKNKVWDERQAGEMGKGKGNGNGMSKAQQQQQQQQEAEDGEMDMGGPADGGKSGGQSSYNFGVQRSRAMGVRQRR